MSKKVTHVRPGSGPYEFFMVDGTMVSRERVVSEIRLGVSYVTSPPIGPGADIHVVKYGSSYFLRTDKNERPLDNLGSLPSF